MAIVIRATGKALPKKNVANAEFEQKLETSDEWIRSHTGIESRYLSSQTETASYLGARACSNALESANKRGSAVRPEDISILICATATPDYPGFPSTACVIQKETGTVNAAAFDVTAACSGFIYGMETAAALMERRGFRYALVVGAEMLSKVLDWNDRSTCVLFGDGAGAVLLERIADSGEKRGLASVIIGSDGNGAQELYIGENGFLQMNGRSVYTFAVAKIAEIVESLLQKEELTIEQIDLVVCHQANERIISAAAKRLGYDMDKFVINIQSYGNTSSASIPITLADLESQGRLRPGMNVLLAGFGAGLTWGGCIIRW